LPPNQITEWFDPAFITPFGEKPDYVSNTRVWKVERETETTEAFFYHAVGPAQVALYAKGLRSDDEPVRKPNLRIRTKGASRTLTTRAMAAAPGALTLFNGGS